MSKSLYEHAADICEYDPETRIVGSVARNALMGAEVYPMRPEKAYMLRRMAQRAYHAIVSATWRTRIGISTRNDALAIDARDQAASYWQYCYDEEQT